MRAPISAGETDAAGRAAVATGKLRAQVPERRAALTGRVRPQHRCLLGEPLRHRDDRAAALARVRDAMARQLASHTEVVARRHALPGVNERLAQVIMAEVGTDRTRFPTAQHLARWAALCAGTHARAGKRGAGPTRNGRTGLRWALVDAARGAAKTTAASRRALYHRIKARCGAHRRAVGVGHRIRVRSW